MQARVTGKQSGCAPGFRGLAVLAVLVLVLGAPGVVGAQTLDGDIQDLLDLAGGMSMGTMDATGCAVTAPSPLENVVCDVPSAEPCAPKVPKGPTSFYFVNGSDITDAVVVYYPATQQLWLGMRVATSGVPDAR